jgi:hypothetical protein
MMPAERIVHVNVTLEEIRAALQESPLAAIRQELTDQNILDACDLCKHRWRDRLYNPIVTVFHFIAQALQRELSFAATWQQLWTPVAAAYPEALSYEFDPSALTHARGRLPQGVLEILAADACRRAGELPAPRWKKLRLLALDASALSMPRETRLFDHFGIHRARSTMVRYPLATFVSLLETGSSLVLDYRFGPFDPGETATAAPLLANLKKGDLMLADRHFSNAPFIIRLRQREADFLMRKNARLKVDNLPMIKRIARNDFITELSISKPARKNHPDLPPTVRARVFKAAWKSPDGRKVSEWFVTSLEDAGRFKRSALARLYHERWRAETSYLEFKQTFHADVLRSKTLKNIYKEFAAHILGYQLVRLLMAHAARRSHKKPTLLSTINAARWIMDFSRAMAVLPAAKLPRLYLALLDAIASSRIDVRPGRTEPRARSRESKHYPRLRISRQKWRAEQLGAPS